MQTLSSLGFTGYYETVTPGSGTRPDTLTQTEQANLSNDGTTGVGAVWNLYYAQLPNKANVIAYISSVADNSGGNDTCQASDTSLALTSTTMDSWSATRWITRIAGQYGLAVGGENPGYGLPASIDSFYTNTSSTGMMATAIGMALSCNFKVYLLGPRHPPVGRHPPLLPLRLLDRPLCRRPRRPGADRHRHGQ